jgi:universal stress protein A
MAQLYRHILLATDLTEGSDYVADRAKQLAQEWKSSLSIVHAIDKMPIYAYGSAALVDVEEVLEKKTVQEIRKLGEKLGVDKASQYIVHEPSKLAILHMAKEVNADLIVVGSHGQHGFFTQLASTTNAVLNTASRDVLVVRHPDYQIK